MKKIFFKYIAFVSTLFVGTLVYADHYDVINAGLTIVDKNFSSKYSYPLNESSKQEAVNAACNRQKNFIIEELRKAKAGSQAREQLLKSQNEMNTACNVLESSTNRSAYHKKLKDEAEAKRKKEEKEAELARAKEEGPEALEAKKKEIAEREAAGYTGTKAIDTKVDIIAGKIAPPTDGDPGAIGRLRGDLSNEFKKLAKDADAKLFNLIGDFLSKIDIPPVALKVFNNDLAFKNMQFLKSPSDKKVRTGLGFTGTTKFNQFSVKGTVYVVQDIDKKIQYSLSLELPDNYKVSDMFPKFKKADVLDLPKGKFVASTFNYTDPDGFSVQKGFNFIASLLLEGPLRALGELRKKAKQFDSIVFDFDAPIYLQGVIASMTHVEFKAVVPMRLGIDFTKLNKIPKDFSKIINKITTDDIIVGVAIKPIDQSLNAQAGIRIVLGTQPDPLRIQGFGGIDILSGKINFGGKMPDMLELKFVAIGDVKIELYLDPAVEAVLAIFGVPVSGIALGGRIDLGKPGDTRASLSANGKLSLEAKKAADFVLEVEGKNMQFAELVSLVSKMAAKSGIKNAEIPASKIPVMTVNRVYGKIAPWDTEIAGEKVSAGFKMVLDAQLFDKKFGLDVDIKHKDLKFAGSGYMSEIAFKANNNVIFKLSGPGPDKKYGTPDDGPIVSCEFNAKNPLQGSFMVAAMMDVPPIGLKSKVDLKIADKKFKFDFESEYLGFTTVFGINMDPAKWQEMYIKFGFKGDFQKFISEQARPAIESLKKEASQELAKLDKKIGALTGELEKLKKQQTATKTEGVGKTDKEIKDTKATIARINTKIKNLKSECDNAVWYRKADVCARVGIELTAQGTALGAQETYLRGLLKPGKEVIKGTFDTLNAINQASQKATTTISEAKVFQKSVEGVLGGLSKALDGISKGLNIIKVSEAVGEISMKDLSQGKLPKLLSFKAETNIPELPKVKVDLENLQFDFKNPKKSAEELAKKLVGGIKVDM